MSEEKIVEGMFKRDKVIPVEDRLESLESRIDTIEGLIEDELNANISAVADRIDGNANVLTNVVETMRENIIEFRQRYLLKQKTQDKKLIQFFIRLQQDVTSIARILKFDKKADEPVELEV